jgi:hypothetical protein
MGPRAQRADKLQRASRDFKSVTYGPGIKTVTYVIGTDLELDGAPGEIRTPDLLVRSQTLYPTELRARVRYRL